MSVAAAPISTTAQLGKLTLLLQAACLLAALLVYLVEHLYPGAIAAGTGLAAATALQTIGSIAVGGGVGGGLGAVGHGVRHYRTAAPTSAMLASQGPLPGADDPDTPTAAP